MPTIEFDRPEIGQAEQDSVEPSETICCTHQTSSKKHVEAMMASLGPSTFGLVEDRSLPNVSDVSILISLRCGLQHNAEPPGTTGPSFGTKGHGISIALKGRIAVKSFQPGRPRHEHSYRQMCIELSLLQWCSDLRLHISRNDLFSNGSN